MRTLLSFKEFVNETFGAISMEFPPGHDRPLIQTPDIIKPLSISGPYGGNARIPRQWNNAPYLSGGFSGSGYGHFGAGPSDMDTPSELKDGSYKKYLKKDYKSLDDAKETLTNLDKEISKRRRKSELLKSLKDIDERWKKEAADPKTLEKYESELEGHPLEYSLEMAIAPTPGHPGSYMDPPEPGDPGEYKIRLDGSDSNKTILKALGFSNDDMRKIFSLDLNLVFNHAESWSNVSDIKQLSSAGLGFAEETEEELDREYFDDELGHYSGDLFEDLEMDNALAYLAFKYIIIIGIERVIEKTQLRKETLEIGNAIRNIPREHIKELLKKRSIVQKAASKHLDLKLNRLWSMYRRWY